MDESTIELIFENIPDQHKENISSIVEFVSKKFRLTNRLSLWLQGSETLYDECNELARTLCDDGHVKPKEYTVILDTTVSLRTMMVTLCHELVHVKQYAKGEIKQYKADPSNITYWNGKKYNRDKMDYYDFPWEIEAHGREEGLFVQWCQSNQIEEEWTFKDV